MADFVLKDYAEKHTITGPSGTCEVRFNPTDVFFLERLSQTAEALAARDDERTEQLRKAGGAEAFALFRALDEEARRAIDALFNAPVCESAFAGCFLFAAVNDLPLWLNILLAAADAMYEAGVSMENRAMRRLKSYENKYTAKYKKGRRS